MPVNPIKLMEVPDDDFAVAPEHVVPTLGNVNHLFSTLTPSSATRWYRSQPPTYICCLTLPSHPASCGKKWGGRSSRTTKGSGVWGAAELDSSSPHHANYHGAPLLPHYTRLVHPPRAVERGLSTEPGGAGVAGAPLGGASH